LCPEIFGPAFGSLTFANKEQSMSRTVVGFAGIVLFSLGCVAQQSRPIPSSGPGAVQSGESERPLVDMLAPPQQLPERSVSLVRLRVPRKSRELYEKARKAFGKHRYAEAQQMLNQALQGYPAFPEALTMKGYTQIWFSELEPAEQNLLAAIRTDPTYGLADIILADLYNTERRFDDALAAARRASALIPDSWVIQFEIARALLGNSQYESALSISDAALRANGGTLLHVLKAHALIGLERYSEAVTELRTYLQYQPLGELSQDAHDLLDQIQGAIAMKGGHQ